MHREILQLLSYVYTTQPVGQPVVQQVGSLYTRESQFANQLPNPLANKLQVCIHGTAGWPTGCTIGWKLGSTYTRHNLLANLLSDRLANKLYQQL